jgi:hypothetical protein
MTTRFHLDTEGWDTVVEMINWCLTDIEGFSWSSEGEDPEEDERYDDLMEFRDRVQKLAQRMGLKKNEMKGREV